MQPRQHVPPLDETVTYVPRLGPDIILNASWDYKPVRVSTIASEEFVNICVTSATSYLDPYCTLMRESGSMKCKVNVVVPNGTYLSRVLSETPLACVDIFTCTQGHDGAAC